MNSLVAYVILIVCVQFLACATMDKRILRVSMGMVASVTMGSVIGGLLNV